MSNGLRDEPELLPPLTAASPIVHGRTALAVAVASILGWVAFATVPGSEGSPMPYGSADLGSTLVTPIDTNDPAAMRRASRQHNVSGVDRIRLEASLADGTMKLGLLAFFDDMDPDGDTVQVSGAGFRTRIVLRRGLTPVVLPYEPGKPLAVTAVHDGGGTVTVALMTRTGPVHLRRLMVGESVGVATP